ncbi:Zn-dependent exopeptidase [Schizophyllum commune H4-8]|uniref:Peptide hydrolase n=1 Tax=Schizophyllum commune (strain H4-8 / FGSC 9210) TaxID=578458 RepID=D8Q5F3_SCHCM|nr:Zn-dependent exopeptidase [Schizophyllum commune H4-8]KAI5892200.1 Zn-dependent exopeptidase [Schizophyllum commune H4-8]
MSLAAIDAISSVRRGPGFLDITQSKGTQTPGASAPPPSAERVYPPPDPSRYPFLQSRFFKQVNATGLYNTVDTLSNGYTTRAYQSPNARAPALWVQDQFKAVFGSGNVRLLENPDFDQPNVIARIPGTNSNEVVILGAHLDSTAGNTSSAGRAPGADDDASGIAVVLQVAQILARNNYRGSRTIEFHAYAGEEGGLKGSQTVASKYAAAGAKVTAMLQMDMVAYQMQTKPVLTLLTDTDPSLIGWTFKLLAAYLGNDDIRNSTCGYACTDHWSWYDLGYPAVSIDEAGPNDPTLNPYYHSTGDTIDKLNFNKTCEFVKMGLAFLVEQAA